jgi:serine/threonine-protein kinase
MLSHYRVVEKIGEGGMGEVYRAEDTKLGRSVALKVLPREFVADSDRLARLSREAQLLASLNHPNVAAIHGLEESNGVTALALELVEGETLAERIERGPLSLEEAVPAALQIAEALEAAHEKGIIHRDLKPSNVKFAADGRVKVLDFGLAKALAGDAASGSDTGPSMSPTITAGTVAGVVLGTAAYMSPEQARGKPLDRRADIWSFGVVVHEMLTGRRLFSGETVSDVLAAVLRADLKLDDLQVTTPPALRRLLARCLDRDPRRRLRDIGEARILLEEPAASEPVPLEQPAAATGQPSGLRLAALLAAALILGFLAGWFLGPTSSPPAPETRRLLLAPPPDLPGPRHTPQISPDGRAIAYLAGGRLWVQRLDQFTPRQVTSSEETTAFAWSPDSRSLAFSAGSLLWRSEVGGDPVRVAELPNPISSGGGVTWKDSDTLLFTTGRDNMYQVPSTGGSPQIVLAPDPVIEDDFHTPAALPGGAGVLFVTHRLQEHSTLEVMHQQQRTVLLQEGGMTGPFYDPTSGRILFTRSGPNPGIWALPFSLSSLTATGPPELVTSRGISPSTAADGSLLYANMRQSGNHRVVLVGQDGTVQQSFGDPMRHIDNLVYSPEGTRLAACITGDLWVFDLQHGTEIRLVQNANCGSSRGGLTWTPDGEALVFGDTDRVEIRQQRTDGAVGEAFLAEGQEPHIDRSGRWLASVRRSPETGKDIWIHPLDGSAPPTSLLATPADESEPQISPDGSLLAFQSNQSGKTFIYLRRMPPGEGLWQVSSGSAERPRWSKDGSRLFYLEDNAKIFAVPVNPGPPLHLGAPEEIFSIAAERLDPFHGFDTAPDGSGLVTVQVGETETESSDLTLELNWAASAATAP